MTGQEATDFYIPTVMYTVHALNIATDDDGIQWYTAYAWQRVHWCVGKIKTNLLK